MFTVVESTVVVVPETCKLPVITIVSPESVPITMFSFEAPPEDSKFASLVNKLALLTSTSVFVVNVRLFCMYVCRLPIVPSLNAEAEVSCTINESPLAKLAPRSA